MRAVMKNNLYETLFNRKKQYSAAGTKHSQRSKFVLCHEKKFENCTEKMYESDVNISTVGVSWNLFFSIATSAQKP